MSPTVLLALQSLLVSLQIINVGLTGGLAGVHINPLISLVSAAIVGGLQSFVQHAGNQIVPPPPPVK